MSLGWRSLPSPDTSLPDTSPAGLLLATTLPNDLDHALGSGVQNLPSQICVLLLPRHSLGLPGAWRLPSPGSALGSRRRSVLKVLSPQSPGGRTTPWCFLQRAPLRTGLFGSAQLPTPSDAWLSLPRCWDINANASIWWVIRGPVILSILVSG